MFQIGIHPLLPTLPLGQFLPDPSVPSRDVSSDLLEPPSLGHDFPWPRPAPPCQGPRLQMPYPELLRCPLHPVWSALQLLRTGFLCPGPGLLSQHFRCPVAWCACLVAFRLSLPSQAWLALVSPTHPPSQCTFWLVRGDQAHRASPSHMHTASYKYRVRAFL